MFQHIFCDEVLSIMYDVIPQILKVKHLIGFCSVPWLLSELVLLMLFLLWLFFRGYFVPFKLQLHGMVKLYAINSLKENHTHTQQIYVQMYTDDD